LKKTNATKIQIYAHPEVSAKLSGQDIDFIDLLEEKYSKTVSVRADNSYHIEQYEIFTQDY
jgi:ribonuclease G